MEPISILAFQKMPGIGAKAIDKILSMSGICEPTCPFDLIDILKNANTIFGRIPVPNIQEATDSWNTAHKIWNISQQHGIQIISKDSHLYPECLLQIPDPPVLLHIKGNVDALARDCIAIIGTRQPTDFGTTKAKRMGELFVNDGYVVVGGLAQGIDSAAHRGAMEANGLTVAVLAHGLDTVYPAKNRHLADEILKNDGALVSEYSWGTKSNRSYFVARDRIQSGLALGVLVVEAGLKSGTMHTVRFCKQQNRVLMVVKPPSSLINNPNTQGNIQLIADKKVDVIFGMDNNIVLAGEKMDAFKVELLKDESTTRLDLSMPIGGFTKQGISVVQEPMVVVSSHQLNLMVPHDVDIAIMHVDKSENVYKNYIKTKLEDYA